MGTEKGGENPAANLSLPLRRNGRLLEILAKHLAGDDVSEELRDAVAEMHMTREWFAAAERIDASSTSRCLSVQ